jgi:hypothetical protein
LQRRKNIGGNRYVTVGKFGGRKDRKDGSPRAEKEWQMVVRGEIKTRESIKEIMAGYYQQLKDLPADKKECRIISKTPNRNFQRSGSRRKLKTSTRNAAETTKAQNKLQQRGGCVDLTPIIKYQTPYTGLYKTTDTAQILKEMEFRGLPTDGGWKNQWIPRLRGSVRRREGTFIPVSSKPYVQMWTLVMSGRRMPYRKRNGDSPDGCSRLVFLMME